MAGDRRAGLFLPARYQARPYGPLDMGGLLYDGMAYTMLPAILAVDMDICADSDICHRAHCHQLRYMVDTAGPAACIAAYQAYCYT